MANLDNALQSLEMACQKAQGGSPLLLAQMYFHRLRMLEATEKLTHKFVTDDTVLQSKQEEYIQALRDVYGEHKGVS